MARYLAVSGGAVLLCCAWTAAVNAQQQNSADTPASPDTAKRSLGTIEVTAARLRDARIELSPKVGTTIYSIDRDFIGNLNIGPDTPLAEVLLHFPGVYQDSKASGSLHVRDDHANVQYRINGIQLPEGISGFGQAIDTRIVDRIDFLRGALPAQYGLRTAGIVDIETKDGAFEKGGSVGFTGGGHDWLQPSAELVGSKDRFAYYASVNYLSNSIGIENPTPSRDPIHDRTSQLKGFGYFSYVPDASTRVALMIGTYDGRFQIPNNPGQQCSFALTGICDPDSGVNNLPSSSLDQNQRESNRFAVLAFQRSADRLDYQLAAYVQYSRLHYVPDPAGGDLAYTGVASDVARTSRAAGMQADAAYRLNAMHTVRFGAAFVDQLTRADNSVLVYPTDDQGNPISAQPVSIVDNGSKNGDTASLYLQDEFRVRSDFTVNYGVRFDRAHAFTAEQQWSPRVNALWKLTAATAVHGGYSRYFTPPPQELVQQPLIEAFENTTAAPEIATSDPPKAERTHYFDVGVTHVITPRWTIGADAYYKRIKNLLDEGQFGPAIILTPFNYAKGRATGVELSTTYSDPLWTAYANVGIARAQGKEIVSGQSLFGADELAYIADHYIYLDHDQRYSVSAGAARRFGATRVSADLLFGSGLRNTPDGAPPNSGKLPSYTQVNVAITHEWPRTVLGAVEGRVAIVNLFDETYLLRDGTGVGVGAPQYGMRRTFFAGATVRF